MGLVTAAAASPACTSLTQVSIALIAPAAFLTSGAPARLRRNGLRDKREGHGRTWRPPRQAGPALREHSNSKTLPLPQAHPDRPPRKKAARLVFPAP